MFGTHDLALFVIAGLLLNITPGADTLYIVGRSASQGARAGAVAALGIGAGCFVHVSAAAFGLSALLSASALGFAIVKYVGAAYLFYLGISMIVRHRRPADPAKALATEALSRVFWGGFLTNALNPKVALFFLAFLPAVHRPGQPEQGTRHALPRRRVHLQRHALEPVRRLVIGDGFQPFQGLARDRDLAQPRLRRAIPLLLAEAGA